MTRLDADHVQVIEDYFYPGQPFSQRRHVLISVAIVFISMGSKCIAADSDPPNDGIS